MQTTQMRAEQINGEVGASLLESTKALRFRS